MTLSALLPTLLKYNNITQGIVDGSASKPALRQDTGYMVEKTFPDIAPYKYDPNRLYC